MEMAFQLARSNLPKSEKRKYFFQKRGVFRDFIRIFALSFDTISTTKNSKPKKSIGYEHIEKAIWWAKNY